MADGDYVRLGSTVRSRALGAELRAARRESPMKFGALVERLGVSPGWLSKLELGTRRTDARNVARLLGFYQVDLGTFDRVMGLYRETDDGILVWEHGPGGVDEVSVLLDHEAAAHELFCYEVASIPDLVQSEDHMRQVFSYDVQAAGEVERYVAARGKRQGVLGARLPVRCTFVVRELVLRHLGPDPEVAWGQLMNLVWLGDTGKVDVRVIACDAQAGFWEDYPFTLMRSPEFRSVVHIGVMTCSVFLDDPREIGEYEKVAKLLLDNALNAEQSRELIVRLADEAGRRNGSEN
ncbi:helix-turn-helix transcriptional regulator [Saccharothrix xinjiangensis]|uniref:Helix-turn-helix domain-containing protein n=1 Tax=Saccharothrix xinjiangensis TaxID=204798 RepID=A0ABV9XY13_9PSEU